MNLRNVSKYVSFETRAVSYSLTTRIALSLSELNHNQIIMISKYINMQDICLFKKNKNKTFNIYTKTVFDHWTTGSLSSQPLGCQAVNIFVTCLLVKKQGTPQSLPLCHQAENTLVTCHSVANQLSTMVTCHMVTRQCTTCYMYLITIW